MIKYPNERIKAMTVVDIALVKWAVLFATIAPFSPQRMPVIEFDAKKGGW